MKLLNPKYALAITVVLFSLFAVTSKAQTVSTYLNGTNPKSAVFDTLGNLFVIDGLNNNIVEVSKTGAISTFVSLGNAGPQGIVIDKLGNLYVSEINNNRIVKVSNKGVISTFVNSGLSSPNFMVFDSSGNLFVTNGNNTIKKVATDGTVSTYLSGLDNPQGLAFDKAGSLYVANAGDNTIRKIIKKGFDSTFLNTGLNSPQSLEFDTLGNLYVSNSGNNTIIKVSTGGIISPFIASGLGGGNTLFFDATKNLYSTNNDGYNDLFNVLKISKTGIITPYVNFFYRVDDLKCDASGTLYVADQHSIFKVSSSGVYSTLAIVDYPFGMAIDSFGNLYTIISDRSIIKITKNGTVSTFVGPGIVSESGAAFMVCDPSGNLFLDNNDDNGILKITKDGVVSAFVNAGLSAPSALACDAFGNLYVANANSNIISKVDTAGNVSTFASIGLNSPYGLSFDKSNNLYVSNEGNNTILKIDTSGNVSFYVSSGLSDIGALAIDALGNLYTQNYISTGFCVSKVANNLLPITFSSFTATAKNNTIETNWHTATELNTNHFIIQHCADGISFTDIGTVKAIGSGANSYSFTDNNPTPSPLNGVVYYRLQSVDKDGSSSFSKVVSVQFTVNSNQLTVYPNPAKEAVTIKGNHIVSVQVIDNMGRVVKVVTLKDATNPVLSVSSLAAGVYHLRIQTTDGKVSGVGFVKE